MTCQPMLEVRTLLQLSRVTEPKNVLCALVEALRNPERFSFLIEKRMLWPTAAAADADRTEVEWTVSMLSGRDNRPKYGGPDPSWWEAVVVGLVILGASALLYFGSKALGY